MTIKMMRNILNISVIGHVANGERENDNVTM